MRLKDWLIALVIIIIFLGLMAFSQISGSIEDIKKNWHLYKCNPVMIPLAGYFGQDPGETFSSCVAGSSTGFVQQALQPIMTIFSGLTTVAEKQEKSANNSRKYSMNIRSKMSGLGSSIFGIVFSFSTELSRFGLKLKDTMSKLSGIIAAFVHVLSTSIDTFSSIWKGPPGQTMRFLGGMCFHNDTKIKLKNGKIKSIKKIELGDILKDGSIVFGKMDLLNHYDNKYLDDMYVFKTDGEENTDIMVTGTHLVLLDKEGTEYVHVKDHPNSEKMEHNKNEKELTCLITNTHVIPIGNHIFGDWEDNGELPEEIKYISKKIKHHI